MSFNVGENAGKGQSGGPSASYPTLRRGLRVSDLLIVVAVVALAAWASIAAGPWIIVVFVILAVASGVGWSVAAIRRTAMQRETLLLALAIATERSMPLAPAARAFADQFSRWYRLDVERFASRLEEGRSLPEALDRAPDLLASDSEVLVRVGWSSGTLPRALRDAAELRTRGLSVWGGAAARFAYLGWILLVLQVVTGFIMYFIHPKFQAIFYDFGIGLPWITIQVNELLYFVAGHALVLAPLLVLAELIVPALLVAGFLDVFGGWRDVAVVGPLFRRRHASLLLRAPALTVEGQKPIIESVERLSRDYPSCWVRDRLRYAVHEIREGRDWVEALRDRALIRRAEAGVLDAAGRVGNLAWALRETADASDRRLRYRLQFWSQLLFPLVLATFGVFVAAFAAAYFLPLVSLVEVLAR